MLEANAGRILEMVGDGEVVLDIGGWAQPFTRADWVIDLMPYETRGMLGRVGPEPERFSRETWIQRDICDREPFPFEDEAIDFAVCSHTLEDIRDPLWVCSEMARVAKAGYVEVPSRLEEQTWGVEGPWAGRSHHRWLVDIDGATITFTFKSHSLHNQPRWTLPSQTWQEAPKEDRVAWLFWKGSFEARERVIIGDPAELDAYLREPVEGRSRAETPQGNGLRRLAARAARLSGRG